MSSGLHGLPGLGFQGNEMRNVVVGVGVIGYPQGLENQVELFIRQQHTHVVTSFQ